MSITLTNSELQDQIQARKPIGKNNAATPKAGEENHLSTRQSVDNETASPRQTEKSIVQDIQQQVSSITPKAKARRLFQSHFQDGATRQWKKDAGQVQASLSCLDITQSKWVQDPDDSDRELVWLTVKKNYDEESTRRSFRWLHYRRDTSAITFDDFQQVLGSTQGLYTDEAAVATKCLKEAKMNRLIYAGGKYFEPFIHQASTVVEKGGDSAPVKATFVSIPILALYADLVAQEKSYPSSRELRQSDKHPIRTLLQYSNILAIDSKRDGRQVINQLDRDSTSSSTFIHVPEFWALIINMYTIITCAPFEVTDLCGDNIKINPEDIRPSNQSMSKNRKLIVKYTSLQGTLHDFQCRTWFGLLDLIARSEGRLKEFKTLLNNPNSDYQILDTKYRIVDRTRWTMILENQSELVDFVHLRLVRTDEDSPLNLEFVSRKLKAYAFKTLIYLASTVVLQNLERKYRRMRLDKAVHQSEVNQVRQRIESLTKTLYKIRRSRHLNRLMLYAGRYRVLHPTGKDLKNYTKNSNSKKLSGDKARPASTGVISSPKRIRQHSLPALDETNSFDSSPTSQDREGGLRNGRIDFDIEATDREMPKIVVSTDQVLGQPIPTEQTGIAIPRITINDEIEPLIAPQELSDHHKYTLRTSKSTVNFDGEYHLTGNQLFDLEAQILGENAWKNSSFAISLVSLTGSEYSNNISRSHGSRRPAKHPRRHSTSGSTGFEILHACPQRLPLGADSGLSLFVPVTPKPIQHPPIRSSLPSSQLPQANNSLSEEQPQVAEDPDLNVEVRAAERIAGSLSSLNPFFEWVTSEHTHSVADQQSKSEVHVGKVMEILDLVDSLICDGNYFPNATFNIVPSDYEHIVERQVGDVIDLLEAEQNSIHQSTLGEGMPPAGQAPRSEFLKLKIRLFLAVYGLLRCFVHQESHGAKVIRKIWGVVHKICSLSARSDKQLVYPNRHDTTYVLLAVQHFEIFEQDCRALLHEVRPNTGDDETAVGYQLPQTLLPAFRNLVLYLLGISLAATRFGVELDDISLVKDKINDGLRDAEIAFLRMTEHVEIDDDQVDIGQESIRTADTLFGLLLENAFELSNRETRGVDQLENKLQFDLRYVYSRYTSRCITRAKQQASARVYEAIRLLREEVDTITMILKQQKHLYDRIIEVRESAKQTLDMRLNRRILSGLDDLIRHFEQLNILSQQAEFWTRNSIEVRGEDNGKAIYVFTAVTVIFLPLTFVAGLLGMNTAEIRDTSDQQWLFWAIAIPFTFTVLLICLCIVRYKFRVKRRIRSLIQYMFVYLPWRYLHESSKN